MFSTYKSCDVKILLKDITGKVKPLDNESRETFIQQGVHYSEMLPLEYKPSKEYYDTYERALHQSAQTTANAVAAVSNKIWDRKGSNVVLVSLTRAGTSIGVLIKRFIKKKYGCDIPHYTISIIRGKGIDKNAMEFILKRHSPNEIQFVDGWVGKGAIQRQLNTAMLEYPDVDSGLAVLSDPAGVSSYCGTHEDFLIASSCLNSVVSGLLSRTFYRNDIIGESDFHGAAFYNELMEYDLTYHFIETIENKFDLSYKVEEAVQKDCGINEIEELYNKVHITDINFIKPGIGETTRVLLRRIPWKILVHSLDDNEHLGHIYVLAKEKKTDIEVYPLKTYRACGLIKNLADT